MGDPRCDFYDWATRKSCRRPARWVTHQRSQRSVRPERVGIPRADLEIMSEPPRRWSVVPRPKNPSRFPGVSEYGVCPNCRERVPLRERLNVLRCTRCNGAFDVAWEEQYLMEN